MTEPLGFESFLHTLRGLLPEGRSIGFLSNPGNAGDGLICAATWRTLDLIGRSRFVLAPNSKEIPDAIVFGGGGSLVPAYPQSVERIVALQSSGAKTFVILPQSIRGNESFLKSLDARFHVFCREATSFEHVSSHAARATAYLAHDMATTLESPWLFAARRRAHNLTSMLRHPRLLKRYGGWLSRIRGILPVDGKLTLMRVDVEANDKSGRDPHLDLSGCHGSNFLVRQEAELVARDFLAVLNRATVVESDRLHVCIGAALLGKQVIMHDNNYGKNRAVYEMSLQKRFPQIQLVPRER